MSTEGNERVQAMLKLLADSLAKAIGAPARVDDLIRNAEAAVDERQVEERPKVKLVTHVYTQRLGMPREHVWRIY